MISCEDLRAILDYDPDTGAFTWKVQKARWIAVGDIAGRLGGNGYWSIKIDGRAYHAHRLAFLWMTGEMPKQHVDHIDLIRLNNRWANLRECTRAQNQHNLPKFSTNTSGFKGVSFHQKRWRATICVNGKRIHLGSADTPEIASKLYSDAAIKYFGEFARSA